MFGAFNGVPAVELFGIASVVDLRGFAILSAHLLGFDRSVSWRLHLCDADGWVGEEQCLSASGLRR